MFKIFGCYYGTIMGKEREIIHALCFPRVIKKQGFFISLFPPWNFCLCDNIGNCSSCHCILKKGYVIKLHQLCSIYASSFSFSSSSFNFFIIPCLFGFQWKRCNDGSFLQKSFVIGFFLECFLVPIKKQ